MANTIQIKIIVDGKGAKSTLKDTGDGIENVGKKAEQANKGTSAFGKGLQSLKGIAAGIGLAAVTKGIFDFGKASIQAADEARQVGLTFENLSGGAAQAADNLAAVSRATTVAGRQVVDETTRMQIANQLLGMNIATTSGELEKVIGVSRRLGAEFKGLGAAQAADEFAIMMSNMSVARLDSFGISSGRVRTRIKELMEATEGMTRETAFFQATMEEADATLARLGPEIATTAQAATASAAAFEDFKGSFGETILAIGQASGLFDAATASLNRLKEGAEAWAYVANEAIPAIDAHNKAIDEQIGANLAAAKSIDDVDAALSSQITSIDDVKSGLVAGTNSYDEYNAKLDEMTSLSVENLAGWESTISTLGMSEEAYNAVAKQIDTTNAALEQQAMAMELSKADDWLRSIGEAAEVEVEFASSVEDTAAAEKAAEEATKARTKALEAQQEMELGLKNVRAQYYTEALELETSFNEKMEGLRVGSNDKQKEAQEKLSEELAQIEQERADKIAWVNTGAHERTAAEQEAALAWHNAHYDELKNTAVAKTKEKTDEIIAEQGRAEAAAASAREKEKAEMQAHLDELKLQTALSVLETTGELARMTGLVGVSASEAAQLITSGVLPVTNELGLAIQGSMADMESGMETAGATATANQEVLQQAMDGTLESTRNFDTMYGETLPGSVAMAGEAINTMAADSQTGITALNETALTPMNQAWTDLYTTHLPLTDEQLLLFTTSATELLMVLMEEVIRPFNQLWIDLYSIHFPALNEAVLTFQTNTTEGLAAVGVAADAYMVKLGATEIRTIELDEAGQTMTEEVKTGFKSATTIIMVKLIPALDLVINKMDEIIIKAHDAAKAVQDIGSVNQSMREGGARMSGGTFQHGTGRGVRTVPAGFNNDTYAAMLTSGEQFAVAPRGQNLRELLGIGSGGNNTAITMTNYITTNQPADDILSSLEIARAMIPA